MLPLISCFKVNCRYLCYHAYQGVYQCSLASIVRQGRGYSLPCNISFPSLPTSTQWSTQVFRLNFCILFSFLTRMLVRNKLCRHETCHKLINSAKNRLGSPMNEHNARNQCSSVLFNFGGQTPAGNYSYPCQQGAMNCTLTRPLEIASANSKSTPNTRNNICVTKPSVG
jgi:hypothetical protein